jgi:transposase
MPIRKDKANVFIEIPELEVLKVEDNDKQVLIFVKNKYDYAACPDCGQTTNKGHDQRTQRIRDREVFGKLVYLCLSKRRFRCLNGCGVFSEHYSFLEPYKRQTNRYRDWFENLCRHSSVKSASNKAKLNYGVVDRIYYDKAKPKAKDFEKQKLPKILGIDEFSGKRRVRMHVSITDLSKAGHFRLWDVLEQKSWDNLNRFFDGYTVQERNQVLAIVHDMDLGLNDWTRRIFPRAMHVIDKFHLVRTLLKHLESVRKASYQKSQSYHNKKLIRSSYWLIRRRHDKLGIDDKLKLAKLFEISKPLQEAYHLKEAFMRFYDRRQRRSEAAEEFEVLYHEIKSTPHFKRFCWALEKWREEILNYFSLTYTNGFTEGMNNKIKTLKRQAYGFRNFDRFRVRILNECSLY